MYKKFKLLFLILSSLTAGILVAGLVMAFTGPGNNTAPAGDPTFWRLNGSDMYYSGGNIGIGTTAPGAKLQINEGTSNAVTLRIAGTATTTNRLNFISNLGAGGFNPLSQAGDIGIIFSDDPTTVEGGSLVIGQWSNSAKGIRIDSAGNVGIGLSSPTVPLDVAGRIKFDCSICLGWADSYGATPTNTKCFDMNNATRVDADYLSLGGDVNADDRFWLWMQCP